jgi:hypothetical protein
MTSLRFDVLILHRRGDLHAVADGARNRAVVGVEAQHALGRFTIVWIDLQMIADVNTPDYENLAL